MLTLDAHRQPALAVDLAILTVRGGALQVVLMQREDAAQVGGLWAMPGGFVHHGQSLDQTIARVLRDKIGLDGIAFEQLATYGEPARDPRGHVVSVVYLAFLHEAALPQALGGGLALTPLAAARDLAFDHSAILADTVTRLRGKLDYTGIAFAFLPARFTLRQVQEVHEAILGRVLTKPAFRRKLLDRGLIRATGEMESGNAFRPAELYEIIPEVKE